MYTNISSYLHVINLEENWKSTGMLNAVTAAANTYLKKKPQTFFLWNIYNRILAVAVFTMTCFPEHSDKPDFTIHPEQEISVHVLPGCLTHSLLGRGRLLLGLLLQQSKPAGYWDGKWGKPAYLPYHCITPQWGNGAGGRKLWCLLSDCSCISHSEWEEAKLWLLPKKVLSNQTTKGSGRWVWSTAHKPQRLLTTSATLVNTKANREVLPAGCFWSSNQGGSVIFAPEHGRTVDFCVSLLQCSQHLHAALIHSRKTHHLL